MLGLESGTVKLVPYTAEWQTCFATEAQSLCATLTPYCVEIRHIGSTAIPNIMAKPILDIMAGLQQISDITACLAPLAALGYVYHGEQEVPGWHFFTKAQGDLKTHHVHIVAWQTDYWRTHLLFQEYIYRHSELAEAYETLKRDLAQKFVHNREAYTAGKADFIHAVVEMALRAQHHAFPATDCDCIPPRSTCRP